MAFITIGNRYLPETETFVYGSPVEWPAPTSPEGLQYWLDQMDMHPNRTLDRLAHLEDKDVPWVGQLFELLCKECS